MSTLKEKAQEILNEKDLKIIPENIKDGVEIFDITGTYSGGSVEPTAPLFDIRGNSNIGVISSRIVEEDSFAICRVDEWSYQNIPVVGNYIMCITDDNARILITRVTAIQNDYIDVYVEKELNI